ncbi:hypothetical protein KVR01_011352 [Diaporthe batatas]|uniref:uncharacterized protein n=1 Tax=Diaporthe batatas TaxID=748121 RepID=UPI001D042116|nr:uncharacterized protein KVR01_011352 [Diaporthe batatas]KAG8158909.1 hypothetical protein KVR01_011352 [Diaporthe batatas]
MAARVLSRGPSVVLSALRGPAWRLPGSCPASGKVLAGVSSRRWSSQLPPGVQDGEALSSVTSSVSKGKEEKAPEALNSVPDSVSKGKDETASEALKSVTNSVSKGKEEKASEALNSVPGSVSKGKKKKASKALKSVPGSVSKEKKKKGLEASAQTDPPMNYDDRLKIETVREAVDVSGGTAPYKALISPAGVFFYKQDGTTPSKHRNFMPHTWLRDNCRCPKCVNQETMQRSFNILTSPLLTPRPLEVQTEERGVKIIWPPERHESFYDWAFLEHYFGNHARLTRPQNRDLWGAEIKENPPTVTYSEVMDSEEGVAKMTSLIMKLGLVFVEGTPFDDSIHTKKLLERIGPIRETHYGGFYDFIPDMAKADTAYTNIALAAHTDTTYFTDPVGLQAFHLLSHTPAPGETEATGGESLLVDGFHAASKLKSSAPSSFKELTQRDLPWHASGNEGVTITPDRLFPVIELGPKVTVTKIRWNNDDRGVVPMKNTKTKSGKVMAWYIAAAKWEKILRSKELEYWYQLRPGTTVIFNNHRVLHGRSAFTGLRRICGGYINMDDFVSRWRNTNLPREQVMAQVIG